MFHLCLNVYDLLDIKKSKKKIIIHEESKDKKQCTYINVIDSINLVVIQNTISV